MKQGVYENILGAIEKMYQKLFLILGGPILFMLHNAHVYIFLNIQFSVDLMKELSGLRLS